MVENLRISGHVKASAQRIKVRASERAREPLFSVRANKFAFDSNLVGAN